MKRLLLLAMAVCLMATTTTAASAQSVIGLNGGVTYSKLSGDYFASGTDDHRLGFLFGGNFAWFLSDFAGLRIEGNWLQKGGKGTTTLGSYDAEIILNYFEFPLILTAGVPIAPTVVVGAMGGIAWGYRVNCNVKVDGGESEACINSVLLLNPNSSEWSVPLGLSLGINIGSAALLFDARYSLGLTNLSRIPDTDMKTQGFQGLVRLGFPI